MIGKRNTKGKNLVPRIEKLSEQQMNGYYSECVRQMSIANYKPDVIVGIMRGGVDFSNKLSHYFSVPTHAVAWQTRDGYIRETSKLNDILKYFVGQDVLIVDDICDTAKTFKQIAEFIHNEGHFAYVSYAAAIHNHEVEFEVDFTGRDIRRSDDTQWFEFPWENWWS